MRARSMRTNQILHGDKSTSGKLLHRRPWMVTRHLFAVADPLVWLDSDVVFLGNDLQQMITFEN